MLCYATVSKGFSARITCSPGLPGLISQRILPTDPSRPFPQSLSSFPPSDQTGSRRRPLSLAKVKSSDGDAPLTSPRPARWLWQKKAARGVTQRLIHGLTASGAFTHALSSLRGRHSGPKKLSHVSTFFGACGVGFSSSE